MINPKYSTHYGDIIKSFIRTYRVPVSVFAYNVEQIAYCSDHDARFSAMSNHRVCLSAARRPVREYCGVKADEYVFHQAFRRLFVHFILNEYLKNLSLISFIVGLVYHQPISTICPYVNRIIYYV